MGKSADIILLNGKFYTENKAMPCAEAVAVTDGKFSYVGDSGSDLKAWEGLRTRIIDLGGKTVLPGLIDGHVHPETIAKSAWRVTLPRTDDLDELLGFVRDYCKEHSKEEVPFFFGEAYATELFDENGPTKELLDRYVSDRPARLQDFTDHGCWYNSAAIELLGITKDTPDPEGPMATIRFIRDIDGNPTGWVQEPGVDNFESAIFEAVGWYPPDAVTKESMMPFLDFLTSCGVIAFLDGITEGEEAMRFFRELDDAGDLHFYYEGTCLLESFPHLSETIETLKKWQKKYTGGHVGIHTVKYFLDGTNEVGSCASLLPFANDPTGRNFGQLNMTEDELTEVMIRLNHEKIDLHIHIVCDRAFRTACNAVERARKACGDFWRIHVVFAHCELVHPEDMPRVAKLGIIINWSCHWSGGYFGETAKDYLGEERWNSMYDFTKIIESGGIMTYSSDVIGQSEAKRGNPFFGMECACRRVDPEFPLDPLRYPGSVRPPENAKLPLAELVGGYTARAAIPLRFTDRMGTIEAGKLAHLVVLEKDLFSVPEEELHTVKPIAVLFEGQLVYGMLD